MCAPDLPRSFSKLSQAEEEDGQSRICLEIRCSFDKAEWSGRGRRLANYGDEHVFMPVYH
jgi:hypothetical protein